jgi:hypothetical protein
MFWLPVLLIGTFREIKKFMSIKINNLHVIIHANNINFLIFST